MDTYISPDKKIEKTVLVAGKFGEKPYDESECKINITDCPIEFSQYNKTNIIIGDSDGDIGRTLDACLCTMHAGERSKFTLYLDKPITVIIELLDLKFNGIICNWDARKKYNIALKHKAKGVKFFNDHNNREAAFRFTKGLKTVSLIPIDVEVQPETIDDLPVADVNKLKTTLYNNLSSCYFRNELYGMVMELCKKVLQLDSDNVKALYKIGVAFEWDRNYEEANRVLNRLVEIEPNNKAAREHLGRVRMKLREAEQRLNNIMKKMISATVQSP